MLCSGIIGGEVVGSCQVPHAITVTVHICIIFFLVITHMKPKWFQADDVYAWKFTIMFDQKENKK